MLFQVAASTYTTQRTSEVPAELFGANILFDRDDLQGTFGSKSQALGVSFLRFPGGNVTEDQFNLSNPEVLANTPTDAPATGLVEYLTWCANHNSIPSIVLPTKQLLSDPTNLLEYRTFLQQLSAGRWGPTQSLIVEIGNEYYSPTSLHPAISAAEYGLLASTLSKLVAEVLPNAQIAIQLGRNSADAQAILNCFLREGATDLVDLLVVHQYPASPKEIPSRFQEIDYAARDWHSALPNVSMYLSEWNVALGDPSNQSIEYGHRQIPLMIDVIMSAVRYDFELAAVWGLQQNGPSRLTLAEGRPEVLGSGALLGMLARELPSWSFVSQVGSQPEISIFEFRRGIELDSLFLLSARDFVDPLNTVAIELGDMRRDGYIVTASWLELFGASLTPLARLPPDHWRIAEDITRVFGSELEVNVTGLSDFDTVLLSVRGINSLRELLGTSSDEWITALGQVSAIEAGGGNDRVDGSSFADRISLGGGDDLAWGNFGDDIISGGNGRDQLYGGQGSDRLIGQQGADQLDGGEDSDIYYVDGADAVSDSGTVGYDVVLTNDANGVFLQAGGWSGIERISGFLGNDTIDATGATAALVLLGGAGGDSLTGGAGADVIVGGDGNDVIDGGEGNDMIQGGAGADTLRGGGGNDTFLLDDSADVVADGGAGADRAIFVASQGVTVAIGGWLGVEQVTGSAFSDAIDATGAAGTLVLQGGGGGDTLTGGGMADTLVGGVGDDVLAGGSGDDILNGGAGADTFWGGDGNDWMFIDTSGDTVADGGAGTDVALLVLPGLAVAVAGWTGVERVYGSIGSDTIDATGSGVGRELAGNDGADVLTGGAAGDVLRGGTGADILTGAGGNDTLTGDADADTFVFAATWGADRITDWQDGTDRLAFQGIAGVTSLADLVLTQSGANTVITLLAGGTDQVTVANTTATNFDAGDFVFS